MGGRTMRTRLSGNAGNVEYDVTSVCVCVTATHGWRGDVRRCGHVSENL